MKFACYIYNIYWLRIVYENRHHYICDVVREKNIIRRRDDRNVAEGERIVGL